MGKRRVLQVAGKLQDDSVGQVRDLTALYVVKVFREEHEVEVDAQYFVDDYGEGTDAYYLVLAAKKLMDRAKNSEKPMHAFMLDLALTEEFKEWQFSREPVNVEIMIKHEELDTGGGKNLVGEKYGKWFVLRRSSHDKADCVCDCGTKKSLRIKHLLDGTSRACRKCIENGMEDFAVKVT